MREANEMMAEIAFWPFKKIQRKTQGNYVVKINPNFLYLELSRGVEIVKLSLCFCKNLKCYKLKAMHSCRIMTPFWLV
jgi:hypothetical protein